MCARCVALCLSKCHPSREQWTKGNRRMITGGGFALNSKERRGYFGDRNKSQWSCWLGGLGFWNIVYWPDFFLYWNWIFHYHSSSQPIIPLDRPSDLFYKKIWNIYQMLLKELHLFNFQNSITLSKILFLQLRLTFKQYSNSNQIGKIHFKFQNKFKPNSSRTRRRHFNTLIGLKEDFFYFFQQTMRLDVIT